MEVLWYATIPTAFHSFFFHSRNGHIFVIILKPLFFIFIQISADGVDGEEIHLTMPPESELSSLVAASEFEHKKRLGICPTVYYP